MNYIKVWRFEDAPKKYQLEEDDVDWIGLVPKKVYKENHGFIGFLDSQSFGCCNVSIYKLKNGDRIYIGCHS